MRNAAANFDDDIGIEEPARKKVPRRSASTKPTAGKRKKKGKSRFRVALDSQKVARFGAVGMSAAVVVGIMVNALMMQKSRHPAPLFGKSIALGQGTTTATPAAAKVPATQKVTAESKAPRPVPKPEPTRLASHAAPDSGSSHGDPIGQLLQDGAVPADKTIVGVQRALTKLGFTVKPTGTFGPQTRKALERFEKDRHLPVKDELTRRVIKVLTAESGIKIEH